MKKATDGAFNQRPRVCCAKGKKTNSGKPLKTVYICKFFPSHPGLHPEEYFGLYHTQLASNYDDDDDDDDDV